MARKSKYADMFTLRPDGRYQGYYRDDQGKRHIVCKKDPEDLYNEIQRRTEAAGKPKTFDDIAVAWHNETWDSLPPGTQASYSAHYDRALDYMGDMEAEKVEPADIYNHLEKLASQNRSASTIKKQRTIYSLIFSHAINHGLIKIRVSPADAVKMPKKVKKAVTREAPESDIIKKIQNSASTAPFGVFPLFLICTGMRRGEALATRWDDIDLESGFIHCHQSVTYHKGTNIADPKTDAGTRDIPILAPLKPYLEKPEDAKGTDFVFPGENPAKPMPISTFERRWLRYCMAIGCYSDTPEKYKSEGNHHTYIRHNYKPTLTPHMLRHGYATMLYEAEIKEQAAKKFMGHSDIAITQKIYTHLREKKEKDEMEKLLAYTNSGIK